MATWTNVSSTVLEPGDPIRSVDIIAIKENIIALSEGASGAPKIVTAAINDSAVTTSKIANASVTAEKLASGVVASATAGASLGAVGTYAMLAKATAGGVAAGATTAGSELRYSDVQGNGVGTPSGTWRAMGRTAEGSLAAASITTFLRIS
jgi:hypothetical protein